MDIDDLGEPSQTCEMCEAQEIRYVHYMQHPEYPDVLGVGCVCAENMEEDPLRPREREKRLRSLAGRRKSWARRNWRVSAKGNAYINTEGYNLTVFPSPSGWRVTIRNRRTLHQQVGRKTFSTEDAAKAAGLTALLWAKEHLTSS